MKNNDLQRTLSFFMKEKVVLVLVLLITILVSFQNYLLGLKSFEGSPAAYTNYNNYVIFKNSAVHLVSNQNLYTWYLNEQWDLFKYSPTFALFMGLFIYLPDWVGLLVWNLLNSLVLFFAINNVPYLNHSKKVTIQWFILLELITSLQNAQSNALILGLVLWAFIFVEQRKSHWAVLCILLAAFIKPFALAFFVLFAFHPRKSFTLVVGIGWTLLLLFLPLGVISFSDLVAQYQNWGVLLKADHTGSAGLSVMGVLNKWFTWYPPKGGVTFVGILLLLLPLLRFGQYKFAKFRLDLMATVLIWVVVFNHKAESPTFVIAMGGVGIWYFSQHSNLLDRCLILLAFVFTSLSPTDVFPSFLRESLVYPYVLKAAFCIFIWMKLTYELLTKKYEIYPLHTAD